jgi:hypothetical protein
MKKLINKLPLWMTMLLVTFYSCQQEDHPLSELQGTIRFGGISLEFAPMGSPGSRITGNSTWVHVFPNSADLVFINKATGQQYVLEYNPNDFSAPTPLPCLTGPMNTIRSWRGGYFQHFCLLRQEGNFPSTAKTWKSAWRQQPIMDWSR